MKKYSLLLLAITITLFAFSPAGVELKPGAIAPGFILKDVNGTLYSSDSPRNKNGMILIFTCNHCPFSQKYEDRIIELDNKYAVKGFPVVAINSNDAAKYPEDSYDGMKIRAKQKGYKFPYLHDETQEIAKFYGASKTPHVFILTRKEKEFTVAYVGAIDDNVDEPKKVKINYIDHAMKAILAEKPVDPNQTKAIGCSIKWKE